MKAFWEKISFQRRMMIIYYKSYCKKKKLPAERIVQSKFQINKWIIKRRNRKSYFFFVPNGNWPYTEGRILKNQPYFMDITDQLRIDMHGVVFLCFHLFFFIVQILEVKGYLWKKYSSLSIYCLRWFYFCLDSETNKKNIPPNCKVFV